MMSARDQASKLERMDRLLLFACGLYGIVTTLTQYLGAKTWAAYIATLAFGVAMPVYVGYIRGAIIIDSVVERARGWIYLVFGTIAYVVWIWVWYEGERSPIVMAFSAAAFFCLVVALILVAPAFGKGIVRALGGTIDSSVRNSFLRTGQAILWMSILMSFITVNPTAGLDFASNVASTLIVVLLSVVGIWDAERHARMPERDILLRRGMIRSRRALWLGIVGLALLLVSGPFYLMSSPRSSEQMLAFAAIVFGEILMLLALAAGWTIGRARTPKPDMTLDLIVASGRFRAQRVSVQLPWPCFMLSPVAV